MYFHVLTKLCFLSFNNFYLEHMRILQNPFLLKQTAMITSLLIKILLPPRANME